MNGLALLILSTAVGMATCNEFKPMKPIARELKPSSASSRIINGARAPINRYPYSVSLQFFGEHFCGASLIAPDLVLSAAHCKRNAGMVKINPHSLSRPIPVSEQFNVVEEYVHPFYGSPSSVSNDMMIVKFNGNSSLAPVRINDDNAQPKLNERLVVMGWGITSTSGLVTSPDILHHVNVSYIDNEQCVAMSQGAYDGEITDDMLCAQGPKKDSCQGDSGGPLVIPGDIGAEDVQVGVVSWGFGCAEAQYPGVYARTSEEWAWIRFIVCGNSGDPPEYFRCDEGGTTFSPAPTATPTAPTVSAAPSGDVVDVLVAITLDFYPDETGFKIRDTNGNILFEILAGEYQPTNSGETVTHLISLNQQADYVFLLTDSFGDGFEGEAFVYLGTSEDPDSVLAYYSPSISLFSFQYEIPFVVGQDFILNLFPTEAPRVPSSQPSAEPSAPSFSPAPSGTDVTVLLVISLDSWAEETGFRVESETGDVIREVIPGTFSESQSFQVIRDEFQVPSDGTFNLVLLDTFGDGLRTPVYLYLGSEAADQILAHYDPVVSLFDFFISIPFQATTDGIIQIFPTAAPTGPTSVPSGSPSAPSVSSAPSTIDTDVFVQIETGVFGEDMSWSIHSTDGELLHSVPAGTYLCYSQYDERVILAENREFVFTIYDEYGDGFRGNVTLYLGSEPAVDKVIYRFDESLAGPFFTYSAFFTTSENATIDVFPSMAPVSPTLTPSGTPSSPTVSLAPSAPSLLNSQVTVVMVFDAFPFETGYRIENSLGAVVHEVLADDATVSVGITDTFTLPPGDYVFVITDDFGDGFDGQAVVYLGETPLEDNVLAYHGAESFPFSYEQGYDFTPSSEGILDIIIPPPIFFSASGDFEVTLVVDIDPSEPSPMDIAWQLVRIDVPNIWITAPAVLGGLTEPYLESRRYEHRFLAKAGALFVFYIISFGEGNFRGGYEIYFGNNTLPVVKGSGASLGGGGTVHKFVTVEPENTTSLSQTLTAEISFHNNPIGFDWFIQKKELDESSQVIGFGPSGFLDVGGYAEDLAFTTIEAEVTLPMIPPGQTQTFELMQRNTNGTGTFRIWLGPIESGILVLDAAMPTMIEAFSSTTFVIESTATTTPSISMMPSASPKPSTRPSLSTFPTSTRAPSSSPSTSMPSSQFQAPLGILFNFPDSVGWTLRTEQRILASKDSFVSSKRSAEVSLDSLESPQRLEFYIFSGAVDPLDPDSPLSGSYKITSGNTTLAEGDQELGTARTHFFYVGNSGTFPVTMFLKASALKNDFFSWQLSRVNFFGPDELLNNSLMFADPGASIAATSMVTEGQLHGLEINADSQDVESQHIAVGSADAFGGRRLVPTERNNFFVAREIFEQPVAANSNNTLRLEISFGNDPSQIGWALYMNNESSTPVSASRQGDSALQGLTLYTFGPGAEYTTSTSTTIQEEEISLPDIGVNRFREFTFVIYNRSGQGLRPNGEYKVYDGARLIALGSIASGFGDRHIFSRAGPTVPTASPSMAPSSEATTLIPTLSNAEEEAKTGPPVALGNDTGTGPATTSGSLPNVSTATVVTFAFVVSLMF